MVFCLDLKKKKLIKNRVNMNQTCEEYINMAIITLFIMKRE